MPSACMDFEVIAATFGYSLGVGTLPIQRVQLKADRRDTRGTGKRMREIEMPKEVHITPRMYQKLAEKIAGQAGRAHSELPDAAVAEAGALFGRKPGALCAGRYNVHAFHVANPAVSGFDRASRSEKKCCAIRQKRWMEKFR